MMNMIWPFFNNVNATRNAAQLCDPAVAIPTNRSSADVEVRIQISEAGNQ